MDTTDQVVVVTLRFSALGDKYHVNWESPILGQRVSSFELPFSISEIGVLQEALNFLSTKNPQPLENVLQADQVEFLMRHGYAKEGKITPELPKLLGQKLLKSLIDDSFAEKALETTRNYAITQGKNLTLILRFSKDAILIAALPWEIMWDEVGPVLFGHGSVSGMVRYVEADQAIPPEEASKILHVLALTPHARTTVSILEEEAVARIQEWTDLVAEGIVKSTALGPVTLPSLVEYIQSHGKADVIYFFGHMRYTNGRAYLLFDDNQIEERWVDAERITSLLGGTKIIFLNPIVSNDQEKGSSVPLLEVTKSFIDAGIKVIVAMQISIPVEMALRFTQVVFRHLAQGRSIQDAVNFGRQALYVEENDGFVNWCAPTITIRGRDASPLYLVHSLLAKHLVEFPNDDKTSMSIGGRVFPKRLTHSWERGLYLLMLAVKDTRNNAIGQCFKQLALQTAFKADFLTPIANNYAGSEIVLQLNRLSMDLLGVTFSQLCLPNFNERRVNIAMSISIDEYTKRILLIRRFAQWQDVPFIDLEVSSARNIGRLNIVTGRSLLAVQSILDLDEKGITLIVGPGGSGKTALLERTTLLLLEQLRSRASTLFKVPFFLELHSVSHDNPLEKRVFELFLDHGIVTDVFEFNDVMNDTSWQPVFFFDSLHEVSPDSITAVVRSIENLSTRFPNVQIILTVRSEVYRGFFAHSNTLVIKNLTIDSINNYIQEVQLYNMLTLGHRSKAFMKIISRPLGLVLYTSLSGESDINGVFDLLQVYLSELIRGEILRRGLGVDWRIVVDVLCELGFDLNEKHSLFCDHAYVASTFERGGKGIITPSLAGALVNMLVELAVLRESNLGIVQFYHQLFQDYFASRTLNKRLREGLALDNILNDYWWDETLLLLAEQSVETDKLITKVASYDKFLAAKCMIRSGRVLNQSRIRLEEELLSSLRSKFRFDARRAADSLCALKFEESIDQIVLATTSEQEHIRQWAIYALGEMQSSVDVIINLLQSDLNREVRAQAAYALKNFRGDNVLQALINGTADSDWKVNRFSVFSLGIIANTSAIPTLADRMLHDWNSQTIIWSAYGLTRMPTEEAVAGLINALIGRKGTKLPMWLGPLVSAAGHLSGIVASSSLLYKVARRQTPGLIDRWISERDWGQIFDAISKYLKEISSIGIKEYLSSRTFVAIIHEVINYLRDIDNKSLYWLGVRVANELVQVTAMAPTLLDMLRDEDTFLALWTYDALGELFSSDLPTFFFDSSLSMFSTQVDLNIQEVEKFRDQVDINTLIVQASTGATPTERMTAVLLLSNFHETRVFECLIDRMANDQDYYVRWVSGISSSRFEISPSLVRLLRLQVRQNPNKGMIWWLAYLKQAILPEELLPVLFNIVLSDDENLLGQWQEFDREVEGQNPEVNLDLQGYTFIRRWAAYLTGRVASVEDLPRLTSMLQHNDQFIKDCAYEAIENIKRRFYLQKTLSN